jgi:hypothetical protein
VRSEQDIYEDLCRRFAHFEESLDIYKRTDLDELLTYIARDHAKELANRVPTEV